jgi:hypothetical protein
MGEQPISINLVDQTLFGNDAAEDEAADVFDSYFVSRQEVNDFLSPTNKLLVLRAYRGEGKSAVLRKTIHLLSAKGAILAQSTGSSLSPAVSGANPDEWTRGWKRAIFGLLACEIGSRIGVAWSDDAMSLVEEAEKEGFKSRSFVSGVCDRLQKSPAPLARQAMGTPAPEGVVQRWLKEKPEAWVFVDDVDENFQNTPEFRAKIASFFSACRQIVNKVPEIRIRTVIRPNVWTIVRAEAESLSKAEQYMRDLVWDEPLMRSVLAKRIEGYLERSNLKAALYALCNDRGAIREEKLIRYVFQQEMAWGYDVERHVAKYRPPHVVMCTLSQMRPRWMIELAKAAAKVAKAAGEPVIRIEHISGILAGFGQRRIADLSAEYSSLCPQIGEIITAFAGQSEDFKTADLHRTIENRVLPGLAVSVSGVGGVTKPSQVAALLYEIGFLTARQALPDGKYQHYSFAEKPDLLHSRANIDQGMSWEIHPVFRQALGLRSADGTKQGQRYHRSR